MVKQRQTKSAVRQEKGQATAETARLLLEEPPATSSEWSTLLLKTVCPTIDIGFLSCLLPRMASASIGRTVLGSMFA